MGMFDEMVPLSESFEEGEFFTLTDARVGSPIETEYGEGIPAQLKIRKNGKEKWYSVFGQALVNQVSRMEPNELRGGVEVTIARKANKAGTFQYKVLATREQLDDGSAPF